MHVRAFSLAVLPVCALAVAACGGGGSGGGKTPLAGAASVLAGATAAASPTALAATSPTEPAATAAAPATTPAAGAVSAEAWCALVIEINTRHGYMKDKRFLPIKQVSSDVLKAILEEEVSRRDEILAITPAEIKDTMTAALDYFVTARANNYKATTPLGAYTQARQRELVTFQQDRCGITFG